LRQTSDSIIAHFDETKSINLNNVYNIGTLNSKYNLKYVLALLNSKLINLYYQSISQEKGRLFAEVKKVYLEQIPIKILDRQRQAPIITLVEQILAAKKADPKANTSALETQIDCLVYQIFGLTDAEIAVVEGKNQKGEKL
jgi:adenine-specific DNA-methyltransferase